MAVRAYYRVWARLPYVREGMIGVGVYALSEEGRRRFAEFPEIIADDGYVRMLFSPSERVRVDDAPVRVYAPEGLSDLVRIKTRSRLGRYELRQRFPDLVAGERTTKSYRQRPLDDRCSTLAVAGRCRLYAAVLVRTRRRAREQATRPSTTTSGSAISRHVNPTGADVTQIESRSRRPIAAPAIGCSPRGSYLPSR